MSSRLTNRQQRRNARYYLRERARAHRELDWRLSLLRWAIRMAADSGHPLALEIRSRSTHPHFADELDALTTHFNTRPDARAERAGPRRRIRIRTARGSTSRS